MFGCAEYGCLKQGRRAGIAQASVETWERFWVFSGAWGLFLLGPRAHLMRATCDVASCCCGVTVTLIQNAAAFQHSGDPFPVLFLALPGSALCSWAALAFGPQALSSTP